MGVGDEIIAAGQAQRHFDATRQPSVILDKRGRPRWHEIWLYNPAIARVSELNDNHHLHTITNGPDARPYIIYPFTADTGWTFNTEFRARDHRARIYLTGAELDRGNYVRSRYGRYVLIEPWSKHENLRWPLRQWQALVDSLPRLTFVQHVHAASETVRLRGVHREPASFREACGLAKRAACYVRGESGMCHAAAALGVKQVTIWGGCMDWDVLGGYAKQVGVGVTRPFCGRYKPCGHCAATMAAISVDVVREALLAQLGVE